MLLKSVILVTLCNLISEWVAGHETCGQSATEDRIFGGQVAGIDDFPWMAVLFYENRESKKLTPSCGGALISKNFVLTAAHCVIPRVFRVLGPLKIIRLGEYNLTSQVDCIVVANEKDCADPPIDYEPTKIIIHPDYEATSWDKTSDIALIKLDKNIPSRSDFIGPICLPQQSLQGMKSLNKLKLTAAGWGLTDYYGPTNIVPSPVKMKVVLPYISKNACQTKYDMFRLKIDDSQLCAGGGKEDTCRGDSGAPLMHYNLKRTSWVIYGIVSRGASKCGSGIPSIYTNVFSFNEWISETVKTN